MTRKDGRGADEVRPISIQRGFVDFAEGSLLYECGKTRVLVTASVEERIPDFLRGTGRGWVTAEYSMLPRSTQTRTPREVNRGRPGGRTQEIQRLIGRSLRSICDLSKLPERSIFLDCDVLQADGGTRTASISAAFIALSDAVEQLLTNGSLDQSPIVDTVAAVSAGLVEGNAYLDLNYEEDARADVDFNVVRTGGGLFVEVQGTAEGAPFSQEQLGELLALASKGIDEIIAAGAKALAG